MSTPRKVHLDAIEELFNACSHGIGLAASVAGGWLLLGSRPERWFTKEGLACGIFLLSLIALYGASTLYHSSCLKRWKNLFHFCDHAAIYLLIAGTYTPYCLLTLSNSQEAKGILIAVWCLAILGVISKLFLTGRWNIISTLIYLGMGWMMILKIDLLLADWSPSLFAWVLAGGLSYSLGVIFYLWERLPFNHAIWHLFVLAGSSCHFLGIYLFTN